MHTVEYFIFMSFNLSRFLNINRCIGSWICGFRTGDKVIDKSNENWIPRNKSISQYTKLKNGFILSDKVSAINPRI